jgi:hypothetical protein
LLNDEPASNYEDENFEPNTAKDTHKPIDENAIRVFISYSKHNKSDAQYFRQLFEKRKPVIDGKKVVIWTMNQLLAGSAFDEQIQENSNQQKNHPIHRLNNTLVLAKFLYYLCLTFYLLC